MYCTVHVYVYTRASPTNILARKSARRTKVRRQVGRAERAANAAAVGLLRAPWQAASAGHAESARKSVSVSVSVPWNLSLSSLNVRAVSYLPIKTN